MTTPSRKIIRDRKIGIDEIVGDFKRRKEQCTTIEELEQLLEDVDEEADRIKCMHELLKAKMDADSASDLSYDLKDEGFQRLMIMFFEADRLSKIEPLIYKYHDNQKKWHDAQGKWHAEQSKWHAEQRKWHIAQKEQYPKRIEPYLKNATKFRKYVDEMNSHLKEQGLNDMIIPLPGSTMEAVKMIEAAEKRAAANPPTEK
ncbi:hypothetical protein DM02DRAFT_622692 [Periconia macrospinosa]|uniref:Uncharacterized protein n=1 Tax=Periconia macrospinosa TaxID=97972 RepID=A0A2V1E968_9PLEO|nr:hypothetical protein DM02DRAFT_622692 [Periconia macrospinosa]